MTEKKVVPDTWPQPEVPSRIKKPEWYKGLLVAANVKRDGEGHPLFGQVDTDTVLAMQEKRLCQLCGQRIAKTDWCVFPGSHRLWKYTEAPLHVECARYSALVCPNLRNHAEDIEFSLCKKYDIIPCEPPMWEDPGVVPIPVSRRSNAYIGLLFAHNLITDERGMTVCLTCKSQHFNRMSYVEFMKWSR